MAKANKPAVTRMAMADFVEPLRRGLTRLDGREVVIVGDVGVDEYTLGQVRRISPEAPVPVVEVEKEEARLGLAANVAQNISGLGGVPRLISVIGDDVGAKQLKDLLVRAEVPTDLLVTDSTRPTTRKLRVMVQNHHIVRVDYEQKRFLSPEVEKQVIAAVAKALESEKVVALIIQDYAKGVISESLVRECVALAKKAKNPNLRILADPYRSTPLEQYRGVHVMTPNHDESIALTGLGADELRASEGTLDEIGQRLMEGVQSSTMVITRGREGMRIFEDGGAVDLPTNAKQVFDVTGAGDTVIAALALAWGSGFSLVESCALANFAAGVVVGKVGCVPCQRFELEAVLAD
ncbi:MAG: PfkB family carbohydrate kinase [Bdellovibrionales bacterium]|nr:PfkB family carbohydrate kinase [Bdellovibrionales bacterium]